MNSESEKDIFSAKVLDFFFLFRIKRNEEMAKMEANFSSCSSAKHFAREKREEKARIIRRQLEVKLELNQGNNETVTESPTPSR